MEFIPFEFPKSGDYTVGLTDAGVLRHRRQQFNLTQQQVADAAGIKITQYQRFESGERALAGASMRIGLSVCRVLKLDPYLFLGVK